MIIVAAVQIKNGQIIALISAFILAANSILNVTRSEFKIPPMLFIWSFAVLMMFAFTSRFSTETWIELVWLITGIFVTLGAWLNRKAINHRVEIVLFPTVIIGIASILDYHKIVNLDVIFQPAYAGTRMQGGFDGPNELGAFLAIIIVYVWMSHIHVNKVKFIYTCTAIIFYAIILTWSRGALLTLAVLMCLVMYHRVRYSSKKQRILMFISTGFIVALLILLIINYLLPELAYIRRTAGGRDNIFGIVSKAFISHPLFGQGLNAFGQYGQNTTPHSSYFFTLVSGGIVALSAMFYFYLSIIKRAFIRKLKPEFWAMLGYCILEQSFNNIIRGRVLFLFLILVFFIFAPNYHMNGKAEQNNTDGKKTC